MGKIWTFITKRSKKRKKNRRLKKRLRDRDKVEVKSVKHSNIPTYSDAFCLQETLIKSAMQSDSFWENYKVAQEWQTRHNITWWRSRCIALEHENEILRNKVKLLAQDKHYSNVVITDTNNHYEKIHIDENNQNGAQNDSDDDDMEFNMTEDMLGFFETAERHRRDLQQKRKSKYVTTTETTEDTPVIDSAASIRARKEAASLLYGDVHPKIMAMEAALTATVDRHKDKIQPQYWPNIPLKP